MNGEPKKAEMTAEELPLHKTDKRTGISYTLVGDYYYPDLEAPEAPEVELGQYARMRKKYLKEHRRILYSELLSDCKLIEHLHETEQEALDMEERLIRQMAKTEGITEKLKADDMMAWVGQMNNIRNRAREIVMTEVIYA